MDWLGGSIVGTANSKFPMSSLLIIAERAELKDLLSAALHIQQKH